MATFYGNPVHCIPSAVSLALVSSSSQEKEGTNKHAVAAVMTVPGMSSQEEKYKARNHTFFHGTSLENTDVGYVTRRSEDHQKKGVKSA
eukprot:scaffold709029_cov63-Attheya_sp.AAC.4